MNVKLKLKYSLVHITFLPLYFIKEHGSHLVHKYLSCANFQMVSILTKPSIDLLHSSLVWMGTSSKSPGVNQLPKCLEQLPAPDVWSSGSSAHLGWKSLLVKANRISRVTTPVPAGAYRTSLFLRLAVCVSIPPSLKLFLSLFCLAITSNWAGTGLLALAETPGLMAC